MSEKGTNSSSSWLKRIGDHRDGILVVASIVYVLGYIVWSLNASANNLGLLPAIESQYFLAGAVPAVIIWLVYLGIKGAKELTEKLKEWTAPNVRGWKLFLRRSLLVCFWGSFAAFLISNNSWVEEAFPKLAARVNIVSTVVFGISGFLAPWAGLYFLRYFRLFWIYYAAFILSVGGLGAYVLFVYPNLPQELGGPSPRCAQLDLAKAQVSSETLQAIVPTAALQSEDNVVRSLAVDVYFSGDEFLLVRPRPTEPDANRKLYEIRQDVVKAIVSCN